MILANGSSRCSLLLLALLFAGCGREASPVTVDYLDEVTAASPKAYVPTLKRRLKGFRLLRIVDVSQPLRFDPAMRDDPDERWVQEVVSALHANTAEARSQEEVSAQIVASDVVIVSDVHTCLLHQSSYFALIDMTRASMQQMGRVPILAQEGMPLNATSADGYLLSGKSAISSAFPADVLEHEITSLAQAGFRFLPLGYSTMSERFHEASAMAPEVRPARGDIIRADCRAVNTMVANAVVATLHGVPKALVWIFIGQAHVHWPDGGIAGALRAEGVNVVIVHPYLSETLGVGEVLRQLTSGAWIEARPAEFLAPLPERVRPLLEYGVIKDADYSGEGD